MTVLALDFGGSKVAMAVFDGGDDATLVNRTRISIGPDDDADSVLAFVGAAGRLLLKQATSGVRVGAVSPGVILEDEILLAPNVRGWEHVALARRLEEELGISEVSVANDVKAAALAEAMSGMLRNIDPGLYVNLGTGIACALVIHGHVVEGANGTAGEIGYNRLIRSAEQPPHRSMMLEDVVGSRSLLSRINALGVAVESPQSMIAMMSSNACVDEVVRDAIAELGAQLSILVHTFDPQRVVIGGGMVGSADVLIPLIVGALRVETSAAPQVVAAGFGAESSLHGARLVALRGGLS